MLKKYLGLILALFPLCSFAGIPSDNQYQVKKRYYATEPQAQKFTVSAQEAAYLVKPSVDTYTHFNPGNSKTLYTILPYPDTDYLPKIGKWMVINIINGLPIYQYPKGSKLLEQARSSQELAPAHWVSLSNARGQYILEPINYVFVVYEKDPRLAADRLHALMQKINFSSVASEEHSSGYSAIIGEHLHSQLANNRGQGFTYSNNDFRFQNDHFRIFGAHPVTIKGQAAYLFTTSVSEESGYESDLARLSYDQFKVKQAEMNAQNPHLSYTENIGHHFVSFSNARNNLALALIQAGYPTYYATFGNVVNSLGESTEDHDGNVYVTVLAAK